MGYKVEIAKTAQADLKKLDQTILEAVREHIRQLADLADTLTHLPLKGKLAGLYKLRVRKDYRIIYDLRRDIKVIVIVRVGHRKDIYRE